MLDAGHASSSHATTVHEEGVELNASVGSEKAATAGVESGVIFEDGDSRFDSIEGRTASRKKGVTSFERVSDTGFMGGRNVGGNGPGAAVD
jgi:hypothetical protein